MSHTTYHNRKKMDYDNIHQLAFYGEVKRICSTISSLESCEEGGQGQAIQGDCDDSDGNRQELPDSRSNRRKHSVAAERVRELVNKKGGVQLSNPSPEDVSSVGYLMRFEKGKTWKLRGILGITVEKYESFAVSPLHFACAGKSRESIILLAQSGSVDYTAPFFNYSNMSCKDMLRNDPHLLATLEYWMTPSPIWRPSEHHLFTDVFRSIVSVLFAANAKLADSGLCDDLIGQVAQWVPSSVYVQSRWWPEGFQRCSPCPVVEQ
ncbi:hypothetical protein DIPPA_11527 [Diplonema papillatum]|nr:hypothetical protein DIPPA_11527 [Diplonema papillatum]